MQRGALGVLRQFEEFVEDSDNVMTMKQRSCSGLPCMVIKLCNAEAFGTFWCIGRYNCKEAIKVLPSAWLP